MGLVREFLRRLKGYYPSNQYLEKHYRGTRIPTELPNYDDTWVIDAGGKFVEIGDINYILSEFSGKGICYRFQTTDIQTPNHDHEHSFDGVLYAIARDPQGFDYQPFIEDYSPQERRLLDAIVKRYQQVASDTTSSFKAE